MQITRWREVMYCVIFMKFMGTLLWRRQFAYFKLERQLLRQVRITSHSYRAFFINPCVLVVPAKQPIPSNTPIVNQAQQGVEPMNTTAPPFSPPASPSPQNESVDDSSSEKVYVLCC
jgi:hypothetical protein